MTQQSSAEGMNKEGSLAVSPSIMKRPVLTLLALLGLPTIGCAAHTEPAPTTPDADETGVIDVTNETDVALTPEGITLVATTRAWALSDVVVVAVTVPTANLTAMATPGTVALFVTLDDAILDDYTAQEEVDVHGICTLHLTAALPAAVGTHALGVLVESNASGVMVTNHTAHLVVTTYSELRAP